MSRKWRAILPVLTGCMRGAPLPDVGDCADYPEGIYEYGEIGIGTHGRGQRYLSVHPSKKALAREREALRGIVSIHAGCSPIPSPVRRVNRHLRGWANYFGFGYPRQAFRHVNTYVRGRLTRHLKRRSQRRYQPPEGKSTYRHLADLGLVYL